jgi:hypothetical protein
MAFLVTSVSITIFIPIFTKPDTFKFVNNVVKKLPFNGEISYKGICYKWSRFPKKSEVYVICVNSSQT